MIRIKEQIDSINAHFDKTEIELKQLRKKMIDNAWESNVGSGAFDQDLKELEIGKLK